MAKASRLLPAYLAVGEDALKRQRIHERFKARLDGPFSEFDYDELTASRDLDEEALSRLIASLEQYPMGGGQRLVVVREAQELPKFAQEGIVDYLKDPNPDASLLLLAEKLDKRSRLYRAIRAIDATAVMACDAPRARDLPRRVEAMASELGFSLSYDASRELIDRVGRNMVMLSRTLRTLRDIEPGATRIDGAFIRDHVSRVESPGPWVVADAVAARDTRAALEALGAMGPEDAIGTLMFLTQRIRELIAAQELDRRGRPQDLAEVLGYPRNQSWRVKNHIRDSRRFSHRELVEGLAGALRCEMALKGSRDSESALVTWVLDLCAPAPAGR